MKVKPCGACGELVPAETGCVHWKPGQTAKAADSAARRARRREREQGRKEVEAFRRQMGTDQ